MMLHFALSLFYMYLIIFQKTKGKKDKRWLNDISKYQQNIKQK